MTRLGLPEYSTSSAGIAPGDLAEETIKAVHKEAEVRRAAELDPNEATLRLKFRAAAFSHGARGCPGYNFATMQVHLSPSKASSTSMQAEFRADVSLQRALSCPGYSAGHHAALLQLLKMESNAARP